MSATNQMFACGWKNITGFCTDKAYESAWWNLYCSSGMAYLNGWWYFTDGVDLYKGRTADPAHFTKLTNHNKNDYKWEYANWKLFDIVADEDCVYFSSPDSIKRFDPATGQETTLYTLSASEKSKGKIVDIRRSGNKIVYMISDTFYSSFESGHFTATGSVAYTCDTHTFGEWTVTKEPTCGETGEKVRACVYDGCGQTETETIPATGNHTDADGDGICDDCGADLSTPKTGIARIFARIAAFFAAIAAFFRRLFKRS